MDFSIKVKDNWTVVFPDLEHEVNHPAIKFLVCSARCLLLPYLSTFSFNIYRQAAQYNVGKVLSIKRGQG
jgi:hypothetical protein